MDNYIKEHIPAHDWEMMKDANLVTKTDLFRLLLMYYEGVSKGPASSSP